jgi:hypothetical protein
VKCLGLEVFGGKRGAVELANLVHAQMGSGKGHKATRKARIAAAGENQGSSQWIQSIKPRNKGLGHAYVLLRAEILYIDSGTLLY